MDKEDKILKDIEKGYDRMADKFSGTRKYFWKDFEFVLYYIDDGGKVLDFGCGNGRFSEMLKEKGVEYFGVDVSEKLINIARQKYLGERVNFEKISSSGILPFPDDFFNQVVSISVFHHFPPMHTEKMMKELHRVTAPNGIVVIGVWNLWQMRFWRYWVNPKNIFRKSVMIPFRNNQGEIFNRFHHMFSKRELRKIFQKAGFKIEKSFLLNRKNIIVIGRK
jgi:ubiquinone/menaquinone biosynthesis C-methylase UbiE